MWGQERPVPPRLGSHGSATDKASASDTAHSSSDAAPPQREAGAPRRQPGQVLGTSFPKPGQDTRDKGKIPGLLFWYRCLNATKTPFEACNLPPRFCHEGLQNDFLEISIHIGKVITCK